MQLLGQLSDLKQAAPDLAAVEQRMKETVWSPVSFVENLGSYALSGKGKLLRPLLVMLSSSFYPADQDAVLDTAAAVELIHTASLVHDDIVDGAVLRRGQATLHKRSGSRAAVLVGDYLLAKALGLLNLHKQYSLTSVMSRVIALMCEGELEQINGAFNLEKTEEEYFRYVWKKTGCLLGASCEAGGVLSKAPANQVMLLRDFGEQLGCVFQIVDDILDFTGDPGKLGKLVGGDLVNGNYTLPVVYLLQHDTYRTRAEALLADQNITGREVQKLTVMLHDSGALENAHVRVKERVIQAKQNLGLLPECNAKVLMSDLVDQIAGRLM